ncbi:unnamed protein product [Amoebophrya sp. A120]|nr:unnamed protein product [Amoebophrya sp. A120]|eukprot:GSA120T00014598001.1
MEICGDKWYWNNKHQPLPPAAAEFSIHIPSSTRATSSEDKSYEVYDCSYEEYGGVVNEEATTFSPVERGNALWTPEGWEKVTRARQADRGLGERLRRRFVRCCGTKRGNKQKDS